MESDTTGPAGAMNAEMNPGTSSGMNDQTQQTFALSFDADQYMVLQRELTAWVSSCQVSVKTTPQKHGSVLFELTGQTLKVQEQAQQLFEFKESVVERTVRVDRAVGQILSTSHNMDHLKARLVSLGLDVVAHMDGNQQLSVTCLESKVNEVCRCVDETFSRHRIPLSDAHRNFLSSGEWLDRQRALVAKGDVAIQLSGTELSIHGFSAPVKEAADVIHELLKGNSYSIDSLDISDDHKFQLISRHYRHDLDRLVSKDFDERIHIMLEKGEAGSKNRIKFKGGQNDCRRAKAKVQELVASITHREVPCHKPGMSYYLTDRSCDGPEIIEAFEVKQKCVIHVNSASKPAAENVKVIKGDLAKQKVDVIVVPVATANDELSGCGMVASVIGKAAGAAVQDDFSQNHTGLDMGRVGVSKVTGSLSCKCIMYLGIRNWRGYSTRKMLSAGVVYIMSQVKQLGYRSVAFPTVGCGQAGYPPRDVAQVIVEAAKANSNTQVNIAVYEDSLYHDVSTAVRTTVSSKHAATSGFHGRVSVGDITKTRADVLVSAVASDSDDIHGRGGAVARAVCEAAGRSFSREYNAAGGLDDGEVRVQDSHSLHCKKVYHISIRKWKANTEQLLESAIDKCLSFAKRAGYTSVVFPTLGCGQVGYRPHVIARIMRDVIQRYPALKVEVVAYKDDNIYAKFKEVFGDEGSLEPLMALDAETLSLGVYAKDSRSLTSISKDLNKLIEKHYKEQSLKYDVTGPPNNFHRRLRNELARLQNELVFLEMDTKMKKVYIKGEKTAVTEATSKAERVLHSMKSEMKSSGKPQGADCPYSKRCLDYFNTLKLQKEYFNHEFDRCYCPTCHKKRGDKDYYSRGQPAKKYTTPIGWYKFALALPAKAAANKVDSKWHRCFHGTRAKSISKILEVGELVAAGAAVVGGDKVSVRPGHITPGAVKGFDVHQVFVSPSMHYSKMYAPAEQYTGGSAHVAFQILIHPNSYTVGPQTVGASSTIDPEIDNRELEWFTNQNGSTILSGLLVKID